VQDVMGSRERERERVEQPLETAGTMTASATGLDRPGRNSADFLILDSASRERETYQIANGTAKHANVSCTLDVRCRNGAMQEQAGMAIVEKVVCDTVCGALCARDYKSVTSTIDGKLVAIEKERPR
jgi:hypothetical protein